MPFLELRVTLNDFCCPDRGSSFELVFKDPLPKVSAYDHCRKLPSTRFFSDREKCRFVSWVTGCYCWSWETWDLKKLAEYRGRLGTDEDLTLKNRRLTVALSVFRQTMSFWSRLRKSWFCSTARRTHCQVKPKKQMWKASYDASFNIHLHPKRNKILSGSFSSLRFWIV